MKTTNLHPLLQQADEADERPQANGAATDIPVVEQPDPAVEKEIADLEAKIKAKEAEKADSPLVTESARAHSNQFKRSRDITSILTLSCTSLSSHEGS